MFNGFDCEDTSFEDMFDDRGYFYTKPYYEALDSKKGREKLIEVITKYVKELK